MGLLHPWRPSRLAPVLWGGSPTRCRVASSSTQRCPPSTVPVKTHARDRGCCLLLDADDRDKNPRLPAVFRLQAVVPAARQRHLHSVARGPRLRVLHSLARWETEWLTRSLHLFTNHGCDRGMLLVQLAAVDRFRDVAQWCGAGSGRVTSTPSGTASGGRRPPLSGSERGSGERRAKERPPGVVCHPGAQKTSDVSSSIPGRRGAETESSIDATGTPPRRAEIESLPEALGGDVGQTPIGDVGLRANGA